MSTQNKGQQNPTRFFIDIDKFILKFICKSTEARISKTIFKKTNKMQGITLCKIVRFTVLLQVIKTGIGGRIDT